MKRRYYIPKELEEYYGTDDSMDIPERRLRSDKRMIDIPAGLVSNVDGNNLTPWPWAAEAFASHTYRAWGPRGCLDKFCDSVANGSPIAPEVLEGVSESLNLIRTEVDALPPETKSRSKSIGRIAATHLGLLEKKGRSFDERSFTKAQEAAVYFYFCQHIENLSYDAASAKTAEKFNVSERRAQQYNREYGEFAVPYFEQLSIRLALEEEYDALFILTRKIKKGELVAKSEESTFFIDVRNWGFEYRKPDRTPTKEPTLIPLIVRPPTKEQILTIPRWQNPRDRIALLNWWFSNTAYAPEEKTPIGESIKLSEGWDLNKYLFIGFIREYLYPD